MKAKWKGDEVAYRNGIVYTADVRRPIAHAFIVRDGCFLAVGDNDIANGCPNTVDLKGRCVIPGLVDSHCHLLAGVQQSALGVLNLPPDTKPHELGNAILAAMEGQDERDVIAAMGINLNQGDFSAEDIDCVIQDRPVIVFSDDGHALLLNTKAMKGLGIDENTEDPGEQSFFKRRADGKPTGLVIELAAMMMCKDLMTSESAEDPSEILREIYRQYAAYGYTTVFEAMSADSEDCTVFEAMAGIAGSEDPGLRISASFCYRGEDALKAETAITIMKGLRERFSGRYLRCNTLKFILDGTVEVHTALLHEPYADQPDNTGSLLLPVDDMEQMAALAAREGFDIHIHAIGDRAVDIALDVLNGLGPIPGTKTIAHNQLYGDNEVRKIVQAGDICFQTTPHWVQADDSTLPSLGQKRYLMQFPTATMLKNGVKVSFGSDSCLDEKTANPFLGMYFASARGEAECEGLCFPPRSEGIDRESSLLAYTIRGAEQLGLSDETGSIEAGKSADYVILDRDIMTCTLDELKETRVLETFFAGKPQSIRE